jgi:hypothetical protein
LTPIVAERTRGGRALGACCNLAVDKGLEKAGLPRARVAKKEETERIHQKEAGGQAEFTGHPNRRKAVDVGCRWKMSV